MKTYILSVGILLALPVIAFSQNKSDLEKTKQIKENPSAYEEEGGTLSDPMLQMPEKAPNHPDFIIIKNKTPNSEEERMASELKTLRKESNGNETKYQELKEVWIESNSAIYNAMHNAVQQYIKPENRIAN